MQTTAIVVNFNAGHFLTDCVGSLLKSQQSADIVVTDNASSDASLAELHQATGNSPRVVVRTNDTNLGFAAAVNQAAKGVNTQFLLILNPDCRLQPETLGKLENALEENPAMALAGPLVVDPEGNPEPAAFRRFPDPWKSLMSFSGLWRFSNRFPVFRGVSVSAQQLPRKTTPAEAVSGACMLVRREVFSELGGLDEGYGLHCEDLDLMFRLQQAGYGSIFVPEASAVHQQGVSSSSRPMWVHRQKHKSMLRFFRKFQAQEYTLPVRWLVTLGIELRYLLLWPVVWLKH